MLGEVFLLRIFTQNFEIAGGPDAGGALLRRGRAFMEITAVEEFEKPKIIYGLTRVSILLAETFF